MSKSKSNKSTTDEDLELLAELGIDMGPLAERGLLTKRG
jgi:hypothetical protein